MVTEPSVRNDVVDLGQVDAPNDPLESVLLLSGI